MAEPYTIRVFVPNGDPESVKIVDLMNWTGVAVAFPRQAWLEVRGRSEFQKGGVYILSGAGEGDDPDLPTIYVGQGDSIGTRIEKHYQNKVFWDWAFAFVSNANALNRAHTTWLEYALLKLAKEAQRCVLDNVVDPREPSLSESENADTKGFLREMLRILPVLGVRVFEVPQPVAIPTAEEVGPTCQSSDTQDTIVVPAQEKGFQEVFLGQDCWHAVRIGGGMLNKIKYIAAYQSAPISAVTHYAPVDRIVPYGDEGKYKLIFASPAIPLPAPVEFGDAPSGTMQGIRYTSLARLIAARTVSELMMANSST